VGMEAQGNTRSSRVWGEGWVLRGYACGHGGAGQYTIQQGLGRGVGTEGLRPVGMEAQGNTRSQQGLGRGVGTEGLRLWAWRRRAIHDPAGSGERGGY